MSDEITPALLRADAAACRRLVDLARCIDCHVCQRNLRAAAALEEQAARMEQGERVCRWVADTHRHVWHDCDLQVYTQRLRFCPSCGGRVVLGDEEGGR